MPREGEEDSQKAEKNSTQKNQCIGVSRGGRSTKIHAVVDALGNPIHVQLSAGNVHDVKVAQEMLEAVKLRPGMAVLADKAYGKWELREYIANHGADFCIPPKSNESDPWYVDWWLYKERHLVETFFLKLKEFRRVATRYDKPKLFLFLRPFGIASQSASFALMTKETSIRFLHSTSKVGTKGGVCWNDSSPIKYW